MNIYDIEKLISRRIRDLEVEVRELGRQITLKEVLSEVRFDPKVFVDSFVKGGELELSLSGYSDLKAIVNPIKLVLMAPHGIELSTWYLEEDARKFYEQASEAITLAAQNAPDIPF